jgi:hypothetical protein
VPSRRRSEDDEEEEGDEEASDDDEDDDDTGGTAEAEGGGGEGMVAVGMEVVEGLRSLPAGAAGTALAGAGVVDVSTTSSFSRFLR